MGKNLDAILPNFVESEPVTITIGGHDDIPPAQVRGELIAPSPQRDEYRYSLDEVESWYRGGPDLTIHIPKNVIYEPTEIPSSENAKKHKKKGKKQKESKRDLIRRLLNNSEEGEDKEVAVATNPVFPPVIQEHQGFFKEHELYRILTKKYRFGRYGSDLYVRGADGVYSLVNDRTVDKLLMATLTEEQKRNFKISTANGVLRRLQASDEIDKNQPSFPKTKVLMANGCFDLLTKKPVEIEDSDFFVCRINARYLPGEKCSCPYFDHYLETSSGGDKSIQRRICAMLGFLMLSGYPGKKILVLGTAKNSGKSMIIRFYQRLVGPELVCAQTPFDMSEKHALSEFRGKIANIAPDLPGMVIKPSSVGGMKNISGGDRISVNPKGQDRQSVFCFTKQILGTNSPIRLQQFDEAFWDRIEIIPYIHSISPEDRIDNLEELLFEERDAIVTKCLKEARQLIQNGYRFPECPVAEEMKDSWIGWQAYAKVFLQTYCVAEKGCFTASTPLYNAYLQFCEANKYPHGTMTGFVTFAKRLFPSDGNSHPMIGGVQLRGLPDVRYLDNL